ncbi:hypothetical protein EDF31_101618 [Curtobacterium sp. PhB142]|nr:hypothetical protein EDF31_101618 [Curtobacterium sp. PhB142]TCM03866.1 hypothetical protein EDF26_10276 [Curtobacterium sp. PhB134]
MRRPTWDQGDLSLLFVSCDLVGSTAFKQREDREGGWGRQFLEFYRELPRLVGAVSEEGSLPDPEFQLWKVVGDEMIFTSVVRDEKAVADAVAVWLEAMERYEKATSKTDRMQTHGGAFIGTFPGPDSHVFIELDPSASTSQSQASTVALNEAARDNYNPNTHLFDYLGPSVDTGFRVLSESTARHFTVSVEVAWAIAEHQKLTGDTETLPMSLLGRKVLKGVWDGRPYPLLAIDREYVDKVHAAERALLPGSGGPSEVAALCEACSATPGWPSALYLPGSENPAFTRRPEDILKSQMENDTTGAETPPPPAGQGSAVDDDLPTD